MGRNCVGAAYRPDLQAAGLFTQAAFSAGITNGIRRANVMRPTLGARYRSGELFDGITASPRLIIGESRGIDDKC